MDSLKQTLLKLFKNQLIAGSTVLFVGNMFASFGNYLYHLLMGRMLGPVDYGILASLISIIYLAGIPTAFLVLVIVKYISTFRGQKKLAAANYFYRWIKRKAAIFGCLGLIVFLFFSPWISSFLRIESIFFLIIVGLISFVGIFFSIEQATLQAFLRFGWYAIANIINVCFKLALSIILVYLGWRVFGAILALLIGMIIGWGYLFFSIKKIIGTKEDKQGFETKEVISYALPVFGSILAFTSLYTTDIILVRHFLPELEAGYYAALATLGKIIYFASNPIIMVMFPMVSERHANGRKYLNLLVLSLRLVFLVCLGISGVYFLFPKLMVNILYGSQYLSASPYLWCFAIFLSLYSLTYLLVNFYLSIKKVKVVIFPLLAAVSQIVFISFFHQNLTQVVWVSITVLGLLLVSLLMYHFCNNGKTKKAFTFSYRPRL